MHGLNKARSHGKTPRSWPSQLTVLSVIRAATSSSLRNPVCSLGPRGKMWPCRQRTILQRPGKPEDTMRWTLSMLCPDSLVSPNSPPPPLPVCFCLQCLHLRLFFGDEEMNSSSGYWNGYGGNKKAQSLHLKSSSGDYLGKALKTSEFPAGPGWDYRLPAFAWNYTITWLALPPIFYWFLLFIIVPLVLFEFPEVNA